MKFPSIQQLMVVFATVITLVINLSANILPFNNKHTGQISDQFHVYFVPAGYVFAIWGIIYIALIAFTLYQLSEKQRENKLLHQIFPWYILASFANSVWLFLWHYEYIYLTVVFMLILFMALLIIYMKLRTGSNKTTIVENWCLYKPFSIYLGWISVALIANITDVFYVMGWNGAPLNGQLWSITFMFIASVIAFLLLQQRHDIAYASVILWALLGIVYRFYNDTTILWGGSAAVLLVIGGLFLQLTPLTTDHKV